MDRKSSGHEIWARVVWAAKETVERAGKNSALLFEGLPFDGESVRKMVRVSWADYCVILERGEAMFASPEEARRAVEVLYNRAFPEFSAVARALVSPKALYRFLYEVVDPFAMPPIAFTYEDRGADRVRVTQRLRPGARPCLAFFNAMSGGIRGVPRYLGLPPAEVTSEVSPVHGVYDITLPPSGTLVARFQHGARRALDAAFSRRMTLGYDEHIGPVSVSFGTPPGDDREARVADLVQAHHLTPRQAEVLAQLARGRANKEIAQELGCAESTVEAHMTQILRKVGADSRAKLISRLMEE